MNEQQERLSTGVPGLDMTLGGGLLPGAMVFLVGAPGSGKTITAQQMAFHHARAGNTVLYFTALSEPHTKLIAHMKGFDFFDRELLGNRLQLLNLEQALRQGAEESADAVVQMARAERATLVVLDGFRGVVDFVGSPIRVREFLYQFGAKLAIIGATSVLTFEAEPHEVGLHAEMTTADVVLGMRYAPYRVSHLRRLEVIKARGSKVMPGLHSLTIDSDGIQCFPQAEMLPVKPPTPVSEERAGFGLPGLDAMLDGGPTLGSSTLVAGSLGAGKTLLALTWLLEGAQKGESGLLMGFHESAEQLTAKARQMGLDLAGAVADGRIALWTQPPVGLDPNILAAGLRSQIAAGGVRRLVIDTERELERALEPDCGDDYLAALLAYLNGEGVTALFTKEVPTFVGGELDFSDTPTAVLARNLVLLRRLETNEGLRSAIAVLKMRFSSFDPTPHEYTIGRSGFVVGEPLSASESAAFDSAGTGRRTEGAG
jgi:circadian clock protein KaiC